MKKKIVSGVIGIAYLVTLTGCTAVSYRKNEEFDTYLDTPKAVTLVEPDITMYQLTAGGVDELKPEWTTVARTLVAHRLKQELASLKGVKITTLAPGALSPADRDIFDRQAGMFFLVANSVITHTYTPESSFPHKLKHFDYSLGEEIGALHKFSDADAYLFCSGRNYIWTAGRATLAAFGLLVGAATGVSIVVPAGPEWITAALVDANTGNVIWFDYIPMPGDMRKEDVVDRVVRSLFKSFPERWRQQE